MITIEESPEYSRCTSCFEKDNLKNLIIGSIQITICHKCSKEITNLLKDALDF